MEKVLRRRPSAAMLVAVAALIVALGGTAVAAKKLGLGSLSPSAKKKTVGVGKLTYVNVQQTYTGTNPTEGYRLSAACPTGTRVLGGGTKLLSQFGPNFNFFLIEDHPSTTGFTSRFYAGNIGGDTDTVQVTAICGVSKAVTGTPPSP